MKKLLVTGASGFLGWNVCREAQKTWEVFGVFHTRQVEIANVKMLQADLADAKPMEIMFKDIRPDAVIHCAAFPDPNQCQTNPDASYRNNVQAAVIVATLCAKLGVQCVFTSSDLVFAGNNPPYDEESPVGPVNIYGQHKVGAERGMRKAFPEVTICRMPLMFGDAPANAKSIVQPLIAAIIDKKETRLFTDEFRTPVSGMAAAKGLLLALERAPGLLHLGGRERVSRYDIGVLVAKAIGRDASGIVSALQKENTGAAPRARDVSLSSEKAFDLGYDPGTIEEQVRELECVKAVQ
ncbi:MAG TPA: NAD(P)-dependent oxidoreductase [Chitinivibrionales bacterium]|nr:NAD(P)-dependent oxidoreductase [Chitinivibrionales bacterium]